MDEGNNRPGHIQPEGLGHEQPWVQPTEGGPLAGATLQGSNRLLRGRYIRPFHGRGCRGGEVPGLALNGYLG
jgi:hypothetical protein